MAYTHVDLFPLGEDTTPYRKLGSEGVSVEKIGALKAPQGRTLETARKKIAPCKFRSNGRLASFDTAFYRRELLPAGVRIPPPAIVLQVDSTTVIPPGANAITDSAGNIVISLGQTS